MNPASQFADIKQNISRIYNVTGLIANVDRLTMIATPRVVSLAFTQPIHNSDKLFR